MVIELESLKLEICWVLEQFLVNLLMQGTPGEVSMVSMMMI